MTPVCHVHLYYTQNYKVLHRRMNFLFPVKPLFFLGLEVSLAQTLYLINDDVGYLSARKEYLCIGEARYRL